MTAFSSADLPHFKHALQERSTALRALIHDSLVRSDNEQYAQIAGQVHDAEEEALADLLVDVNLADIDRHLRELRDVEAALRRVTFGTYGICVHCHEPIDRERLMAYPTAKRCLSCQRLEEHTRFSPPPPSL